MIFIGVVVECIAVADAVGEVLELFAVAARRVGRRQAAQRRRRGRAGRARAGLQRRLFSLVSTVTLVLLDAAGLPASL